MSSTFRKSTFKAAMSGATGTSGKVSSALAGKISKFSQAEEAAPVDAVKAVQLYSQFLQDTPNDDVEVAKYKELAILKAGQLIKAAKDVNALAAFVRSLSTVWAAFARAKTAKLIKTLLELFDDLGEEALTQQVQLCRELLKWSEEEKRSFLKQALETRLIALFHRSGAYTEALELIASVLRQLKRLDDKIALIEVHLLESRVYFALKNVAKARAALTAARTYANAMYTPPLSQAALDIQAGLLHAEESDFKTAYSYFIEALDNYVTADKDPRGVQAFKYLLLCKIMMGQPEDIEGVLAGKMGQHYPSCRDFEAMQVVATACVAQTLKYFETALMTYPRDAFVQSHFAALYDNLLEKNLLRIVSPYSRIQLQYIATRISLSPHDVEVKLSQMILDNVLSAIIDHNTGCLILQEEVKVDKTFALIQECYKNMDGVVESLMIKSSQLA